MFSRKSNFQAHISSKWHTFSYNYNRWEYIYTHSLLWKFTSVVEALPQQESTRLRLMFVVKETYSELNVHGGKVQLNVHILTYNKYN